MRAHALLRALACVVALGFVGADAGPTAPPVYTIDTTGVTPVQPGQVAGYGITVPTRGQYRVVWTGNAGNSVPSLHKFTGSLVTRGQFLRLLPGCSSGACALEPGDIVTKTKIPGGERIDWSATTFDELDGFEVDISLDAEPLFFEPLIEGVPRPTLVFFRSNGASTSPSAIPFGLTTQ